MWINHDRCECNHDKHTSCYIPATRVRCASFKPNFSGCSQSNSSIHLFCYHHGLSHQCVIFVWAALSESNVHCCAYNVCVLSDCGSFSISSICQQDYESLMKSVNLAPSGHHYFITVELREKGSKPPASVEMKALSGESFHVKLCVHTDSRYSPFCKLFYQH